MGTRTVEVSQCLHAGTTGRVTLPGERTWEEVGEWYVKWDTLHLRFKDATEWIEIEVNSCALDVIDWKRPSSVDVYPVVDGETQYDVELQ